MEKKTSLDATERRRRLAGACLVFAPLLMLVSDAILVVFGMEAGFWPWSIGLWLSFYLFIGAAWAIAHLLKRGPDRLGVTGAAFTVAGAVMGATMMGMFRTLAQMEKRGIEEATIQAVHGPLIPTTQAPGLFFPVGLLILAAGLWRSDVLPRPLVGAFALGAILFPVGRILIGPVGSLISDVLLLAAMGELGRRVLARPPLWTPGLKPVARSGAR